MFETSPLLTGKCMCGAVEYAVDDAFEYAMNCHCSNCRRTTGSAFKPIAGIRRERFQLIKGAEAMSIYGKPDENHDVHCGTCGSLVYSVVREGAYAHVPMGTLVDAPTIRPTAHIFVGSKAPWYEITDNLPQYREFPEG
ncbi:GFA family protein [Rhizobium sp. LjRoot98]|uniref:GFA family protein n=1 Tax=unclassified Rhizobium TaxID=2613769 RepID=UPI000761AC76|nr:MULTISPECIES: GFA family protein [unclassified Rhizobium]